MKKSLTKTTAVLLLGMSLTFPSQAQIPSVAGETTGFAIDQVGDMLQGVIERAEEAGDFLSSRVAQDAIYILDGFEGVSEGILDKTFSQISIQRQETLNGLAQIALDLDETISGGSFDIQQSINQLDNLARTITFRNYPTIYRYRGTVIVPGGTQNIRLNISGYNLDVGEPYLTYKGVKYQPISISHNLVFEIPREIFNHEVNDLSSEVAVLTTYDKTGGFLGLGAKLKPVEYDMNMLILPNNLATVVLEYNVSTNVESEKIRQYRVGKSRKSYGGYKCKSFAYSPSDPTNRRFDPDETKVSASSGNSQGKLENIKISTTGVSFKICAKRKIGKKPGFRHANVHIVEKWTTNSTEKASKTRPLTWTKDIAIPTEHGSSDLLVTVKSFDGHSYKAFRTGSAGNYISVDFDSTTNRVILRPKIPEIFKDL